MAYPMIPYDPEDIFEEYEPRRDTQLAPMDYGGMGYAPVSGGFGAGPAMMRPGFGQMLAPQMMGRSQDAGMMMGPMQEPDMMMGRMQDPSMMMQPGLDPRDDPRGAFGLDDVAGLRRGRRGDESIGMMEALQGIDSRPPSYYSLPNYTRDVSAPPPGYSGRSRRSQMRRMLSTLVPQGRSNPMQIGFTSGRENQPRPPRDEAEYGLPRRTSFGFGGFGRSNRDQYADAGLDPWGDEDALEGELHGGRGEGRRRRPHRRRSLF